MTTVTVSEKAIRELVGEALDNNDIGEFIPLPSQPPVHVNNVVDPSAAETDVINPEFTPQTKQEFGIAIRNIVKNVEDERIPKLYDAFHDVVDDDEKQQKKEEEMKKATQSGKKTKTDVTAKVEEAVRKNVKNMLQEMLPSDYSYSGTEYGEESDDDVDVPKKKKLSTMTDVSGATFEEIAKSLGFSVAGAKQAVDKALLKAQFIAKMDSDEREIFTLNAMNDYINVLKKTGEITSADVQLMKDHPDIVRELDGFREFLDKSVRRLRKQSIGESTSPVCDICNKPLSPADQSEYEAEGGSGMPRCHADCADMAVDDHPPEMDDDGHHEFKEPCPKCGGENTEQLSSPSMMGHGKDHAITCMDCNKTFWADPFMGGYGPSVDFQVDESDGNAYLGEEDISGKQLSFGGGKVDVKDPKKKTVDPREKPLSKMSFSGKFEADGQQDLDEDDLVGKQLSFGGGKVGVHDPKKRQSNDPKDKPLSKMSFTGKFGEGVEPKLCNNIIDVHQFTHGKSATKNPGRCLKIKGHKGACGRSKRDLQGEGADAGNCSNCSGSGRSPGSARFGSMRKCPLCGGTGHEIAGVREAKKRGLKFNA
jgi:hypothetical protein